mgnify:CR=1 FL=1
MALIPKRNYPRTPDGRYFVVKGRLWRCTNPDLPADIRANLQRDLSKARRGLRKDALLKQPQQESGLRAAVQAAKVGLGERGPVWWCDGAPDYNRYKVKNTPYADWYIELETTTTSHNGESETKSTFQAPSQTTEMTENKQSIH